MKSETPSTVKHIADYRVGSELARIRELEEENARLMRELVGYRIARFARWRKARGPAMVFATWCGVWCALLMLGAPLSVAAGFTACAVGLAVGIWGVGLWLQDWG